MKLLQELERRAPIPGKRKKRKVPGGKALARIAYFRRQRGLPRASVPNSYDAVSRAPKKSAAKTKYGQAFLAAQNKKQHLVPSSGAAQPVWVELGPRSIPEGQTYGKGGNNRPPVSGRIASVAVDPADTRHILVASGGGGIWESKDAGAAWQPLTDFEKTLSIGALAFAPSSPSHVYAGTGEGDNDSPLGMGLLRSTDSGATWSLVASATFSGLAFYDIAVDPLDHRHLWVATTGGLYESNNTGTSWTRLWARRTWDLSVAGNGSGELLACCAKGLYRSLNNGSTWKLASLPKAPAEFKRMEVVHAPSDPGVAYVFACTETAGHLWRRGGAGQAFAKQKLPAKMDVGQGWYDWCAAVHPTDSSTLYVGAIELHRGHRGPQGGWKWKNISSRATGDSIHPDQHHLLVSAAEPDTLYVGNDGGLFRSADRGASWEALNDGLGITEFEYLAQHPSKLTWMIGGTQDNGTLSLGKKPLVWDQVAFGDGGDCGIDEAHPSVCYHSFYDMGFEVSTSGGVWDSWQWCNPAPKNYEAEFYPPLEVLGDLVAQAGQSVFISEDRGDSFEEVDLPIAGGEQQIASALAIPTSDAIFVGTTSGNLYLIERTDGEWQPPAKISRPRTGYLSDLFVDPTDLSRIWVCYSTAGAGGHVYLSTDGGSTWADRSTKLPMIGANTIVVDPEDRRVLYVGMDNGVYRSVDEGKKWVDFSNGLPNALVGDLVFHAKGRRLRAGTRSRGVWEVRV